MRAAEVDVAPERLVGRDGHEIGERELPLREHVEHVLAEVPGRPDHDGARTSRAASGASNECSKSIATERIAASGFATSLPAMSGAEPCTGS